MANDEDFEPRPGRIRGGGKGKGGRKFLHRVIAAANLARGGAALPSRRSGFTGSRIGRGAGVGRVLSVRSEEHTSELQSLMRIWYAVFCVEKKKSKRANSKKEREDHKT